ncbi:hypothetical protein QYE76_044807 [Lolium multiflorum]|uniref:Protein kinase domain-containing protein n=1 Tax=Lolium multiflorum TaxID=4521 RepID=A0AAD8WXE9_LOLMU|nr:hypothetical protein QYE76_044807 [Lolium multiflorum]
MVTPRAQVRVKLRVAHQCFDAAGNETSRFDGRMKVNPVGVYRISNTANELFVLGCSTFIYAGRGKLGLRDNVSLAYFSGCVAYCNSAGSARDGKCAGVGCCRVDIPAALTNTYMRFGNWPHKGIEFNPCNYAFIVEKNHYTFKAADLKRTPVSPWTMPLWLDWAIRNGNNSLSCPQAIITPGYTCVSKNSKCVNSTNGMGYTCNCVSGYEGNPYLDNGCTDIDECKHTETYPCFGKCTNMNGYFDCTCPRGFKGNATLPNGCVKSINTSLIIGLSVSSGPAMLLLFLGSVLIIRKVKYEKVKRLKQKFFNQNRGKLLQQLVSHRSDIAERMLIPLKELEKATNNFHRTRKLGGGGHGTVYKGILSDLHVVAIKKSNIVVKREINEFINEVAILSQINHRNIVKLIGCCLETEVPLLAYEFISNGTLCDYLHKEPRRSIPWEDRLRIATEIGKALAYLHSAISVPVIHRDIKSANILLDDALTTKVSDFGASRYIPKDQTCITTMVQGTLGYMDPTYYCSGRLTEKSDVYSFGVILIELLTRKMPITYRSSNGDGLVAQFLELLADCKLVEILDPQVMDEGGDQVEKVAALAMLCIKLRAEERPTMRQVEMTLEGLQSPKEHILHDLQAGTKVGTHLARIYSSTIGNISSVDVSRQYSQEEEFMLSARYPR